MLVWLYRGPLFVPTRQKHVPRIIELLNVKPGEKFADLGSGDGRLLVAIARAGGEAHGYEHNPILVLRSRQLLKREGLGGKAFVHMANFWHTNLSTFNGVIVYGIPYIMGRLEKKLERELKSNARIVSYSFRFPNWQPAESEGGVYLYTQL